MPIIMNTQPSLVAAANIVMSNAFFPRAKKWLYPRLASSYVSVKDVEPFAVIGSVPPLSAFNGSLRLRNIPSYKMQVPNLLFKNAFAIDQTEMEFDQTRTMMKLAPASGIRVAEFPDQLFAKRLLKGATNGSQTVTFRGSSYTQTLDGVSLFSASHPTGLNAATQSNLIAGSLPATAALVAAQDPSDTALQMIADFQLVISALKTVKDTAGMPLFPNLDTKESVVVVIPPCLEMASQLAFRTANSIIQQTTNIGPQFVKDVITSGYLAGLIDPEDETQTTTVSPLNETDWYVFITDDFVKPFYVQLFRPPKDSDLFPPGYSAEDVVKSVVGKVKGITVDQATVFASTRVDTTFNKIGANADAFTIQTESFIVSARMRGNITYGPWFLSWRIYPTTGTASA